MKKSRDYLRRLVEPGPTGGTPVPVLMPAPTLKELLDDADELARLREGLKQILREGEHSQATHDKIYMLLNREESNHE